MRKIFAISLLSLGLISVSFAETKVNEIVCGTGIEERNIQNPSDTFKVEGDITTIYCLSSISTDEAPTKVYHVWKYGDKEMAKVELNINVNSPSYRVWSSKKIIPQWVGEWKLEVQDANGNVLGEKSLKVEK